jgi:membrane associated rhomboid family serine protease
VTRAQTRSRWQGGMLGTQGASATKVILGVNIAYFVVELLSGATTLFGGGGITQLVRLGALVPAYVAIEHDYWRMITSMFMHSGLIHILFNMWALLVIGDFVEAAVGRTRFLAVYFLSGLAGSVMVLVAGQPLQATVGASGALYGVFGALAVYVFEPRA